MGKKGKKTMAKESTAGDNLTAKGGQESKEPKRKGGKKAKESNASNIANDLRVVGDVHVGDSNKVKLFAGNVWMTHSDKVAHVGPVFDELGCRSVIRAAELCADWVDVKDSVDGKPEWQHTAIDAASSRKQLEKSTLSLLCRSLSEEIALPALKEMFGIDPDTIYLHWAFVRSYSTQRRHDFALHRDTSVATVNVLLSSPGKDFTGADLYVLDGPQFKNADQWSAKEAKRLMPSPAALARPPYAVGSQQGELVMHMGRQLHGVLPIDSGERYTLILMYQACRT